MSRQGLWVGVFWWKTGGWSTIRMLHCVSEPSACQSVGARGRQITRGMTGVQGVLPIPSLLQMDIIKPLSSKWGLMTPSGPILGLNKRWKIKLRSKLQPACSRAVYQQCVRNQRRGEKKQGVGCFFSSHLLFCLISAVFSFCFESGEKLWGASSELICLFGLQRESTNRRRWWFKMSYPGGGAGEPLSHFWKASLSVSASAVPYICTQGGRWHESGSPSFTLSESLKFAATVNTSAAASNHRHNGPVFTRAICRIWVAV